MPFFLLSKMAKSKITYIRNTISNMQKCTTITPVISQFLNNRLIVPTICKREDYKRSKHDAVFSPWQILIGSNDWEDFKNGKDGVGRYRVHNLPRKSCTGLYELGVAVIGQDQGGKLDLHNVLPAYVGKSVNVRSRLQDYGRSGGHFPPGLFEDIFSKGGAILYRWVQMSFKREAEAEECKVLSKYDYPLNTCRNGKRRILDLLKKLLDSEFMSKRKSGILHVLFPFLPIQFCIRIKGEKSDTDINEEEGSTRLCEATTKNGLPCTRSSPKGSKRCWQHKGENFQQ